MSDLIRRSDAIKALRLEYPMMPLFKAMREEWALRTEGFRRAEEVIMRLPSADRTQGEWIEQDDCWQCSNCGDEFVLEVDVKPIDAKMHYCPNCGCDMRGGSTNER